MDGRKIGIIDNWNWNGMKCVWKIKAHHRPCSMFKMAESNEFRVLFFLSSIIHRNYTNSSTAPFNYFPTTTPFLSSSLDINWSSRWRTRTVTMVLILRFLLVRVNSSPRDRWLFVCGSYHANLIIIPAVHRSAIAMTRRAARSIKQLLHYTLLGISHRLGPSFWPSQIST